MYMYMYYFTNNVHILTYRIVHNNLEKLTPVDGAL